MEFKELRNDIENSIIYNVNTNGKENYKFQQFSFGERGSRLSFELLDEIVQGMVTSIIQNFASFDYIVAPEPCGHFWGGILSYNLKTPISILRCFETKNEKEQLIERKTAYSDGILSIRDLIENSKVLIVDDVISTGSTVKTILKVLNSKNIHVVGVQVIVTKSHCYKVLSAEYGVKIKSLLSI